MRSWSLVVFGCIACVVAACGGGDGATSGSPGAAPAASAPAPSGTRMPGAAAKSIAIPPGMTGATFAGTLSADSDAEFVIGEEKGTLMLVSVNAEAADPKIAVYRADNGASLPDEHPDNIAHWIERLPESIGYLIVVEKTGTATPFTLNVEVPRQVIFDEAQNSETVFGATAHSVTTFIVPPSQSINAELVGAPSDALLVINTLDDGKKMLAANEAKRSYSGAPGRTDDDIVVRVHQGATGGDLKLRIKRQ